MSTPTATLADEERETPADNGIKGDLSGIEFHIPLDGLFSEEMFRREMDGIFRKSWIPVCHSYHVPDPGDYYTRHIPGLNANVLIVRGRDNVIRAFHNVCRHRGSKLKCDRSGNSRQGIACPYHGWTFNTDGSLRGVPDGDQFPGLNKSQLGLFEIRCDVRHTFVFINFDDRAESLDEWLEDLGDPGSYEGYFEAMRHTELMSTKIRANWNLCIDAFSEGYHTLFVHRNTGGDYLGSGDNNMRHHPAAEFTKWHGRFAVNANPKHKWTATETLAYSFTAQCHPSFNPDSSICPPGVNFSKLKDWAFDGVKFFPNMILLTGRDWFVEFHFWPVSPTETLIEWNTFLRPPSNYGERVAQEFSYAFTKEITLEDLSLLEDQQAALEDGTLKEFVLSFQEIALSHAYRAKARMLARLDDGGSP